MDKEQTRLQAIWTGGVEGGEPFVPATVRVQANIAAVVDKKTGAEVFPLVAIDEELNIEALYTASVPVLRSYAYAGAKEAAVKLAAKSRQLGGEMTVQEAFGKVLEQCQAARGITNMPEKPKGVARVKVDPKEAVRAMIAQATEGMNDKQKVQWLKENGFLPA